MKNFEKAELSRFALSRSEVATEEELLRFGIGDLFFRRV